MFRAKTLLVIGAGASVEVGLPMGAELLSQITKLIGLKYEWNRQTAGDPGFAQALRYCLDEKGIGNSISEYVKNCHQLI